MKAYYSTIDKKYRDTSFRHAAIQGSSESNERKMCPRCMKKQAITIDNDVLISQGGIAIHTQQLYCLSCKERYAIPL